MCMCDKAKALASVAAPNATRYDCTLVDRSGPCFLHQNRHNKIMARKDLNKRSLDNRIPPHDENGFGSDQLQQKPSFATRICGGRAGANKRNVTIASPWRFQTTTLTQPKHNTWKRKGEGDGRLTGDSPSTSHNRVGHCCRALVSRRMGQTLLATFNTTATIKFNKETQKVSSGNRMMSSNGIQWGPLNQRALQQGHTSLTTSNCS